MVKLKLKNQKIANIFNNVFVNTVHKINEKILHTRKSPLDYLSSTNSNSFFVSPVCPAEIKIIIDSITNGKVVGPYSIPVFLLKILSEHIATPLCDRFLLKWGISRHDEISKNYSTLQKEFT